MRFIVFILGLLLSVSIFAEAETPPAFTMTSGSFLDEGAFPTMYTCDGKDVSPQLSWANPPKKNSSICSNRK